VSAAAQPGQERVLRETSDRRLAYDLALVLDAEGIRHRLEHVEPGAAVASQEQPAGLAAVPGPGLQRTDATPHPSGRPVILRLVPAQDAAGAPTPPESQPPSETAPLPAVAAGQGERLWRLWVRAEDEARGLALLAAWSQENGPKAWPPEPAAWEGQSPGLFFAVLCVAGQLATGPRDEGLVWFARGTADAARILHGEPWRALTALTLHADLGHAVGNAAAGWFLLDAIARRVGPAWAAWLGLCAGLLGNLATAGVARTAYFSIGASTAVFGALGALTALQLVSRRRKGWITIGAGVALLAMMGTGEKSDLLAHLFGFVAGAGLGFIAGQAQREAPARSWRQPVLAAAALLPLLTAWALALR
jgi:membrane associated rhomboid family serine protease